MITLAVGARKEDTGGSEAGSVYIFKKASGSETWSQEAKLQASDVSANSQFGMSVSLSGDILAVGANQEDTIGTDAGAAYIFERSGTTWTEVKRITASDGQANDDFGDIYFYGWYYYVRGCIRRRHERECRRCGVHIFERC